jgi:hypothetical protein
VSGKTLCRVAIVGVGATKVKSRGIDGPCSEPADAAAEPALAEFRKNLCGIITDYYFRPLSGKK